jgi:hypothetical protein
MIADRRVRHQMCRKAECDPGIAGHHRTIAVRKQACAASRQHLRGSSRDCGGCAGWWYRHLLPASRSAAHSYAASIYSATICICTRGECQQPACLQHVQYWARTRCSFVRAVSGASAASVAADSSEAACSFRRFVSLDRWACRSAWQACTAVGTQSDADADSQGWATPGHTTHSALLCILQPAVAILLRIAAALMCSNCMAGASQCPKLWQ